MQQKKSRNEDQDEALARQEVLEAALAMSRQRLSPGRSGNVSRRFGAGMLITPSGMAYEGLEPADIVLVGADGVPAPGQRKPSSEWRFHLDIYQARADVGAVVHTHSMHATVLACAHRPIPAFHYMVAVAGGKSIPLVPYATFGTAKLSRHVVKGLRKRNACLMANHGQVAVGASCARALELAAEVEVLAEQYVKVLAIGKARLIDDEEMERVLGLFAGYGQNAQGATRNGMASGTTPIAGPSAVEGEGRGRRRGEGRRKGR
jgi:L-fuculose-phosphate aldolase